MTRKLHGNKTLFAVLFIMAALLLSLLFGTVSADAATGSETESNNTVATANTIAVNQAVTGNLSSSSDLDWYKFTVEKDGFMSIEFTHGIVSTSDAVWGLRIYNSDGATYLDGKDVAFVSKGNNAVSALAKTGIAAGTYYVRVEDWTKYNSMDYTLTVKFTQSDSWEKEGNKTFDKATPIKLNTEMSGNIFASGDVDWYKFVVEKDGCAKIDFTHDVVASTDEYWRFWVYREDAITGYDGKDTYYSVVGNVDKSSCDMGMEKGTYYIKVWNNKNSSVKYGIKINFTETSVYETEMNNSYDAADVINLNTDYYGAISTSGEVDWYKFEIKEIGYINIDFKHEVIASTDEYWRMQIFLSDAVTGYDGSNAYHSIPGNEDRRSCDMAVKPGIYYIKVYNQKFSNKTYNLKVNFTKADGWESELNNTYDKANTIELNKAYKGALFSPSDKDWYKFEIKSKSITSISFTHPELSSASEHWTINVFKHDAVSQIQATSIAGNSATVLTAEMELEAGTYYVQIVPRSFNNSTYTLKIVEKHDHRGEWKTTLAPTCTLEGTRERVCDVCGVKESEVLEPLGHTNNEGVETVKPGFFNKGEITYTCTVCSEESKVETGSKVWLFFIILGAAVLLVIGIINYVKIIKKK